ncbi:hypothetical protein GGI09_001695 [Coemansia sp. S100]|nr:hypothetical protein GGI09_001695 [Coemansia sp. S100]
MALLRRCQSFSDTFDTISETSCIAYCLQTEVAKRRWVASKLSEKNDDDDVLLLLGGNFHKQLQQRPRIEVTEEPTATADTDAEFLSHVLSHFVAFQPLDFPRAPPVDQQIDPLDTPAKDSGGGLWAFLSGALGELTRDVTFIQ